MESPWRLAFLRERPCQRTSQNSEGTFLRELPCQTPPEGDPLGIREAIPAVKFDLKFDPN